MENENNVIKVKIEDLVPNKYQPRKYFDDISLQELASSIKTYGIINPILVRKIDGKYEIIAGERRMRAAKLCGLSEVPVIVKNADEQQSAEYALIENLQRQELTAIESAKAYEEIIKLGNSTQSDLAKKLGKSQSSIANKIRLLSLPTEVQEAITNKKISERHARSLLRVEDKETQLRILNKIIEDKLTVKETENLIDIETIEDIDINEEIKNILDMLNEKEEKEDDNMNNGNFFPTYDNMPQNGQTSLNNLNGTALNVPPVQEPVMPQNDFVAPMNPQPMMNMGPMMPQQGYEQPPMNNFVEPAPMVNMPYNESQMTPPPIMPTMDVPLYTPSAPEVPTETTIPMVDTPLFAPEAINLMQMPTEPVANPVMPQNDFIAPMEPTNFAEPAPMMTPEPTFEIPQVSEPVEQVLETPTMVEQPMPQQNLFEVPVIEPQPLEVAPVAVPENKLEEVTQLLNSKGIKYNLYSNETGHCIIIEI